MGLCTGCGVGDVAATGSCGRVAVVHIVLTGSGAVVRRFGTVVHTFPQPRVEEPSAYVRFASVPD
ncbi:hypothetical protein GCM10022399_10930 [Terrabacter ginsenosidimutans]|uniref:Uncharacterized protein n=1 Tax=Terrabacter ginsenosidimutans TaxID=490575 RepID=A0ABP7CXA7_9MICO